MTEITSLSRTAPTTSASDISSLGVDGITADNVLAYCASRLETLGEVLQSRFAEQSRRNESMKALGRLSDKMTTTFPHGLASREDLKNRPEWREGHLAAARDLCAEHAKETDPTVKGKIAEMYHTLTGSPMPLDAAGRPDLAAVTLNLDGYQEAGYQGEVWTQRVATIKTAQDAMSKDNELSMIQLQSIISQRQLAIQLTTQMLNAMHEGQKGIVGNIRG